MAKRYLTRLQTKLQNQKKRKYTHNTYTDISQINDHIYIGNKHVAANVNQLQEHGITHVVNCAEELEHIVQSYDENMNWLFLPMIDCRYEGNVVDYIPQAIEFIDSAITNNHKVLIHCAAGISRSSSIAIAYIMHKNNLRYDRAYSRVVYKRPCCKPNSRFVEQLKNYNFCCN